MSRRGWKRITAAVAFVVVLAIAYLPLRATVLAPTYDVPSIANSTAFKDAALLERAWALPVAAAFERRVVSQTNGSVCGPSALANALRSFGDRSASQAAVLEGTGKCRLGVCLGGVTLDELADLARAKGGGTVTVHRDLDLSSFRRHLRRSNDPARRYLVNFQRGLLFGKGTGHHSPIGGYLEAEDLVFVLDVNASFGPWLVSSERLFTAIDAIDPASGRKRGLLELERAPKG